MARKNRVDPWGDLHADQSRGLFTGNRGCLVDDSGRIVRHHNGSLWITCQLSYQDWSHPLDAPRTWTPIFFLDDAVALAAGHRPCGLCRRDDYESYRTGVELASGAPQHLRAHDLNRRLHLERMRQGRGRDRKNDRATWSSPIHALPRGTVVVEAVTQIPMLVTHGHLQAFGFAGWSDPVALPGDIEVTVLTPPTSIDALLNGFIPTLHPTACE
ncbi:MAG: hypothetical protein GWP18_04665 [Proteobacteria bacterium]|nr:hypothetical protein [Pseudomonadota bacterium]